MGINSTIEVTARRLYEEVGADRWKRVDARRYIPHCDICFSDSNVSFAHNRMLCDKCTASIFE